MRFPVENSAAFITLVRKSFVLPIKLDSLHTYLLQRYAYSCIEFKSDKQAKSSPFALFATGAKGALFATL